PVGGTPGRTLLDRRGESPLAVLADACAAGGVLAVCADVPRRLAGLQTRVGGPGSAPSCPSPPPPIKDRRNCFRPVRVSPIGPGATLSYALRSRCTSWSTDSALHSSPSTGASGSGSGWPGGSSSDCFAATVRTVVRPVCPPDW